MKTLEGLLPTLGGEYAFKDPQTCGKYVKTLMTMQVRTVRIWAKEMAAPDDNHNQGAPYVSILGDIEAQR